MKPMFGWVEVYRGSSEEEYLRLQQSARDGAIRFRGVEYIQPDKMKLVSNQQMQYNAASARGSSFGQNGAFAMYSDAGGERIYSLRVRRRDLDKFLAH